MEALNIPLLEGLTDEEMTRVSRWLVKRRVHGGDTVIVEGERPRQIAVVESGTADVHVTGSAGDERLVGRLGPGSVVGEMSLLTGQPASATVRAVTDLDLIVLTEDRFHQAAISCPRIYQNLAAILSAKLARSDRRQLLRSDGVVLLHDHDSPPLLGYALACSMAWHTRTSVLWLFITNDASLASSLPEFRMLDCHGDATDTLSGRCIVSRDVNVEPRAHAVITAPDGIFNPSALASTLDELRQSFSWVVVQACTDFLPVGIEARDVVLRGGNEASVPQSGTVIVRGWVTTAGVDGLRVPGRDGLVTVPEPDSDDETALRSGLLPPRSTTGSILGWAARHLCGLKVGLALGAGGAKGYGHVGVLRALRRIGLPVDYVVGSSIGACVAGCVAAGRDADEIADVLDESGSSIWHLALPMSSLISSAHLRDYFRHLTGDSRMEDLAIPLAVVAADLLTQREVVFRRGLVWPAMLASISIPGVFPPQRIGQYLLVDGGVVNPVPADVVAGMGADVAIAVRLTGQMFPPPVEAESAEPISGGPTLFHTLIESVEMMQGRIGRGKDPAAIHIDLDFSGLEEPGLRHFRQGRRFVELGESAIEAAVPRLSATFPWLG